MHIEELLTELQSLGITLWAEGDRLRARAPKGAMTTRLQQMVQAHKAEILAFLQQATTPQLPAIQSVPHGPTTPLSFAQQRLWFLYQLEGPSPTYNIISALRLRGELDSTVLEAAINEIVRRHEALRTTFSVVDGEAVQSMAPTLTVPLTQVDLNHLRVPAKRQPAQMAELNRLMAQAAEQPFDLTQLPLLRVTLYLLGPDDHALLINIHHIIADGWSMSVFMQELDVLYCAFVAGQRSPLTRLPIQYADFAHWQRQWLAGDAFARQLAYWQQQLAGAPTQLNLPTDRPRPPVQTFRGNTITFEIDSNLTAALTRLSQEHGISLFMTVYAALSVLLFRYSGQEDIVIGSPIANRNYRETEALIGIFINTLALRTDLAGNPTFVELLQRVRQVTLDAYAHQDVPFEQVVSALQLERTLSHSPLFQVLFLLHNQAFEQTKLADLQVTPRQVKNETAKFDLSIMMGETTVDSQDSATGKRLWGDLEYNTDLFDETTIQRLIGHFQTLLRAVVSHPEANIQSLPILTEAERHQLLIEWNDTHVPYPQDQLIHQIIEAQAARTPNAIAVSFDTSSDTATLSSNHFVSLSYRELNERANQLGHYLQKLGVGPETLVGICVERSLEMVVGLLGILKAGGAYVPLDPTYPPERLAFMIADAQTPMLLTQAKFKATLLEHLGFDTAKTPILCLDTEWDLFADANLSNPSNQVKAEHLAYMIYTSGSTGKPKGAMNTHANILNRLLWMQDTYQLTRHDHILQKTPFSFDVSVWEFFWPLMFGSRLVVARPEGHKNPNYLVEIINQTEISTLHFVPSMLQLFVEAEGIEHCRSIKNVICSGEALPMALVNRFFARLPSVALHNLYGPTEAAIDVSFLPCRLQDARREWLQHTPIGRPVANTQLYILDSQLQPVPIGVAGELHIGGVQVGRGYHNRPTLTKEKFIANPFGVGRLYKTGDLSRFLPDGNIEFLGRLDHQVKIRGFRIELGEIETALLDNPAVQEAVVVVRDEQSGHPRLFAYVVFQDQAADVQTSIITLRDQLQETLPAYMIPAGFVALDTLPLSPNGKVDRKALPAPQGTGLQKQYVAPTTATEMMLAAIWRDVLTAERVGIGDNFFELGGDSILAVRAVMAMNQAGLPATSKRLFQYQTIADLAAMLDDFTQSKADQPSTGLLQQPAPVELLALPPAVRQALPVDIEDAYPLTGMQALMLDCTQRDQAQSSCYHFQQSFYLKDQSMSLSLFKKALEFLVMRHPALRTVFMPEIAGMRVQIVKPRFPLSLLSEDITHLDSKEQDAYVDALMAKDRAQPFAIGEIDKPLVRFWVLRRSASTFEFGMAIHHAIFDGWGNIELLKELFASYTFLKEGGILDTRPAPLVHKELVALEWEMMAEPSARQFWQEAVQQTRHEPLQRQGGYREAVGSSSTNTQTQRLDAALVARLHAYAKEMKVPLRTVCLSAYLDLIATYRRDKAGTAHPTETVGLIANGRSERLSDPLKALGLFWYMVPFCHTIYPYDKQAQITSVQAHLNALNDYIHYPLPSILQAVDKPELFFATFNFVHFHNEQDIAATTGLQLLGQKGYDRYHPPLNMVVAVDPLGSVAPPVDIELTVDRQYFDTEEIGSLLKKYQMILSQL